MKKMKYIIAALCIALTACDLTEEPYGFYSEDNFYKTEEDAQAALYYAYNTFTFNEYARSIFYINELASETVDVKGEEGFGAQELNNWDYTLFKENEQLELFFKYSYIAINRANAIIENMAESNINEQVKERVLGEAYFLRAWNYYSLAQTFGLIPIQKEMVKTADQTTPPMAQSLDELYDFIISDLVLAEGKLKINKVTGCADKVATQSLLAKVYLSIASSKESDVPLYKDMNKDVTQMYAESSKWAKKVLYDQTTYALEEQGLTNIYNVNDVNNMEHIFQISMDRTGLNEGNFSSIDKMFVPYFDGGSPYFKNPDNTYTKATSEGWGVFKITNLFYNSYDPLDNRRNHLITNRLYKNTDGSAYTDFDYYITRKYIDPDFVGVKATIRPFLIRFSDIVLVYAEAEGPTIEGYIWLNKIRNRAGLSDAPVNLSSKDFRDYVVQERAYELAFEGKRLHDLRRKAMVTKKDPRAIASAISEADAAFYPIPQKEVDLNPNISN